MPSELIKRIIAAGAHRGQETMVMQEFGSVVLGVSLLRITNEDFVEDQPVGVEGGRQWAVLDGRLDNRDELFEELSIPTSERGMSDCRLALLAYRHWGLKCVEKLVGSFALIVWDERAQCMFCTTDHLGTRPLFYTRQSSYFLVASCIRQILQDHTVSDEIDDCYMLGELSFSSAVPLWGSRTPYHSISRIPGGHFLLLPVHGSARLQRYWYPERLPHYYSRRPSDIAEELRHTILTVVRSQLRSSVGVMTTFSGGLDSGSITCASAWLREHETIPCASLHSITQVYPEGDESDEREYRREAIEQYGLHVAEVSGEESWILRGLMTDMPVPDEPFGAYIAWHGMEVIARVARENGCNVLLYGFGGDELMRGSNFFLADYIRQGRMLRLLQGLGERAQLQNANYLEALLKLALLPLVPRRVWKSRILAYRRGKSADINAEGYRPMVPGWVNWDACVHHGVMDEIWEGFLERSSGLPSRVHQLAMVRCNVDNSVQDDYALMPFGCEIRTPFFDRRLIELSLKIPDELKSVARSGTLTGKLMLREAMRDILPKSIRSRRTKTTFTSGTLIGLHKEWSSLFDGSEWEIMRRGYVDQQLFESSSRLWRLGRWDLLGQIQNSLAVEAWLRRRSEITDFRPRIESVRSVIEVSADV